MTLRDIFRRKENRSGVDWDILNALIRGNSTKSGRSVNETTALNFSAVWAALILITETMSTIPLQLFRKTDRGREVYREHPLYRILHDQANPAMTAQMFREQLSWDVEMAGIGLAEKVRTRRGIIAELWTINPDELEKAEIKNGKLTFHFKNRKPLSSQDVLYVYGPGSKGITPRSRLEVARESIGLGLAAEEYGSRFFSQGTNVGGFVSHPKTLSDPAYQRLAKSLQDKYEGLGKSHKLMLLEEGMTFNRAGMTNYDAQFLESRKFQIQEICRWFGLKPHMLSDLEKATFSNIEHLGIEAVTYSWRPRAVRLEQAINAQLLSPEEYRTIYAEHNLNGLMQGDLKSQAEVWNSLAQAGVLNADEIRELMNMNKQDGDQGEIYYMPMNMMDKSTVKDFSAQQLEEKSEPAVAESRSFRQQRSITKRRQLSGRYAPLIKARAAELVKMDLNYLKRNKSKLIPGAMDDFIEKDYKDFLHKQAERTLGAVTASFSDDILSVMHEEKGDFDDEKYTAFRDQYLQSQANRYYLISRGTIKKIEEKAADSQDLYEQLEAETADWEERRAGRISQLETTQIRNAFTRIAFIAAGVSVLRWVSYGNPCPFCDNMNGKVVSVNTNFLDKGADYKPEGADEPLKPQRNISHPPLHEGCDCDLTEE